VQDCSALEEGRLSIAALQNLDRQCPERQPGGQVIAIAFLVRGPLYMLQAAGLVAGYRGVPGVA
jgi:hypothetical protein